MDVLVVGGGVIGASVAYHLAASGVDVRVLCSGTGEASAQSFGWINASFYHDETHHALRVAGQGAYARLRAAAPDLPIVPCGALWWEAQGPALSKMQAELGALGYPVRPLTRSEVARIEPDLRDLPDHLLHFPTEAAADTPALARAMLDRAKALGARVVSGVQVLRVTSDGVETDTGLMSADHVVVAAGTGSPAILAGLGVALPMLSRPGAMVISKPVQAQIGSVLVTPHGEVRQLADGRLMSPAAANHQADTSEAIDEPLDAIAEQTCARLASLLGLDYLEWDEVGVANRPVPQDGLPVMGRVSETVSVAVMHSGVTLAAIAGELLAAQVTKKASTAQMAMLAPYSIDRFNAG